MWSVHHRGRCSPFCGIVTWYMSLHSLLLVFWSIQILNNNTVNKVSLLLQGTVVCCSSTTSHLNAMHFCGERGTVTSMHTIAHLECDAGLIRKSNTTALVLGFTCFPLIIIIYTRSQKIKTQLCSMYCKHNTKEVRFTEQKTADCYNSIILVQ